MHITDSDFERINHFYETLLNTHWIFSPNTLSYNSTYTQEIRFAVLSNVMDISWKSVLDVWCGLWDLYGFLTKQWYKDFSYTWVDILKWMISKAKEKYPWIDFIQSDFLSYHTWENVDIIFASWAMSFKVKQGKKIYFEMIKKMFSLSNQAIAFNMLDTRKHPDDETFITYTVPEIYELCCSLTDKLIIRQDYLPYDFTFYLYH